MERADYEATLRVVANPTAQNDPDHNDSMYDIEKHPFGEIGMVEKFNDFIDRSGVVVNNFIMIKRNTRTTMEKLQVLLRENESLRQENAYL